MQKHKYAIGFSTFQTLHILKPYSIIIIIIVIFAIFNNLQPVFPHILLFHSKWISIHLLFHGIVCAVHGIVIKCINWVILQNTIYTVLATGGRYRSHQMTRWIARVYWLCIIFFMPICETNDLFSLQRLRWNLNFVMFIVKNAYVWRLVFLFLHWLPKRQWKAFQQSNHLILNSLTILIFGLISNVIFQIFHLYWYTT